MAARESHFRAPPKKGTPERRLGEDQAPVVVKRAANFIQWISHYLAVQMYSK